MRLANFTDYSLRVLIYLALKEGELATVAEIAQRYQISRNHLVKVVHNLSTMGIINSFKGKGGGIRLALEPSEINIGKVVKDLENGSHLVECFGDRSNCVITPTCKLKGALKAAEEQFFSSLENYTLMDIVKNKSKLREALSN